MGFEPTALGLGSQCSTTELISQVITFQMLCTKKHNSLVFHCKYK